jgi:hypothetical protein
MVDITVSDELWHQTLASLRLELLEAVAAALDDAADAVRGAADAS